MKLANKAIALIAFLGALPSAALAQEDYPNRPITLIVPFSSGGGVDSFGRIIARQLQQHLGQTVVVENRPGAGGNIGADMAAKAEPDGYTLVVAMSGVTINPWIYEDMSFDVETDLAPIGIYGHQPIIVAVSPPFPADSIQELIDYSRSHPGEVLYATPGIGTPQHMATELFISLSGADMEHVPYQGASELFPDVISSRVPVMFGVLASTAPYIESGQLKALATGGSAPPATMFTELPLIRDTVPEFNFSVWFGIMAPAGTPESILARLSETLKAAVATDTVQAEFAALGYEAEPGTREAMAETIAADLQRWGKVAREIGIALH